MLCVPTGSRPVLANNAIFLKTEVVHGLVNRLFDLLPVGSSLNEFIHILEDISTRNFQHRCGNHLRPVGATITRGVSDDLREILGVVHNKDVAKHLEVGEIRHNALNLVLHEMRVLRVEGHSVHTFNPAMNAW